MHRLLLSSFHLETTSPHHASTPLGVPDWVPDWPEGTGNERERSQSETEMGKKETTEGDVPGPTRVCTRVSRKLCALVWTRQEACYMTLNKSSSF